jgi:hypothetical protein
MNPKLQVQIKLQKICDISVEMWSAVIVHLVRWLGYELDKPGVSFDSRWKQEIYLLRNAESLWGHPASCKEYRKAFPLGKTGRDVKQTAHFHIVLKLRMVELYIYSLINQAQGLLYRPCVDISATNQQIFFLNSFSDIKHFHRAIFCYYIYDHTVVE